MESLANRFTIQERFTDCLEQNIFEEANRENIFYCWGLAQKIHENDRTYGQGPHMAHVLRSTLNLQKLGVFNDDFTDLICAMLLHDVVENQPKKVIHYAQAAGFEGNDEFHSLTYLCELTPPQLGEITIGDLVEGLTNKPLTKEQKASMSKTERLNFYYQNLEDKLWDLQTPWQCVLGKLADNIDNVNHLGNRDWVGVHLDRTDKYRRLPDLFDALIAERLKDVESLDLEQYELIADAVIDIRSKLSAALRRITEHIMVGHVAFVTSSEEEMAEAS